MNTPAPPPAKYESEQVRFAITSFVGSVHHFLFLLKDGVAGNESSTTSARKKSWDG